MAKLAVINRQAKREAMVKKYAERRKQLNAILRDPKRILAVMKDGVFAKAPPIAAERAWSRAA